MRRRARERGRAKEKKRERERAGSFENSHLKERNLDRFQLGQGSLQLRLQLRCGQPTETRGEGRGGKADVPDAHGAVWHTRQDRVGGVNHKQR